MSLKDIFSSNQAYPYWKIEKGGIDIPTDAKFTELELLANFLTRNVFFNKNPNWIEPPYSASIIDCFNPGSVRVLAGVSNLELLKITVPKGHIAVLTRFGNQAEGLMAWDDLKWTIKVDGKILNTSSEWYYQSTANPPVQTRGEQYNQFSIQIGEIQNPTAFSMPIILKPDQIFSVYITNTNATVVYQANARVMGYLWSPTQLTQGGYPVEMHQL